jgi:hypothetical protein
VARLVWGAPGARFYEAGVDRGVLYVDGLGVAWNGLTAVKESSSGGDPTPFYLEGIKYANIAAAEEFEATIEAYSSPREFGPCDGTVGIQNGLFITQQKRKKFGLCYRTKRGNDVKGLEYGYRLHLVYNALSGPTDRDNATLSNSTDVNSLSWAITTTPPVVSGFKPSAHMVIDSTLTPAATLSAVEDILYGTDAIAPRLPSQEELIALFSA